MSRLALLGAVAVGAAFGYGAQRGAFCLNSGFRAALHGEWTKVKALALAVAVQLVLLPAIFAAGLARPAELPLPCSRPRRRAAVRRLHAVAGGCAAGVWYKLGAGDIGLLLAILGMAMGAAATDAGRLRHCGPPCRARSPTPPRGFLLSPSRWSRVSCCSWACRGWPPAVRAHGTGGRRGSGSASLRPWLASLRHGWTPFRSCGRPRHDGTRVGRGEQQRADMGPTPSRRSAFWEAGSQLARPESWRFERQPLRI
jgi:hypothetical protein